MKRIAARPEAATFPTETRRRSVTWGRYVYLFIVGAIIVYLLHLVFRDLYILQGDGFVFSEHDTLALEFDARVEEVVVDDGERVRKGDPLVRFDSIDIRERLTELELRLAELRKEQAARRVRRLQLTGTVDSLERFVSETGEIVRDVRRLNERGLTSNQRMTDAEEQRVDAQQDLASAKSELRELEVDRNVLATTITRIETRLADVERQFGLGIARARRDGVVSTIQVTDGSVVSSGGDILRVFGNDRYIRGFLNQDSAISVKPGDRILVTLPGWQWKTGQVRAVRNFSDALPAEFQPRFLPQQRRQIVEIEIQNYDLNTVPILSEVGLYQPLGFSLLAGLFSEGNK